MTKDAAGLLDEIWRQLGRATVDRKHDFRRVVLATRSKGMIRQRILILRAVMPGYRVVVYTDSRSQKISDIACENQVSLLFYDATSRIQLSCTGQASIHQDEAIQVETWDGQRLKDYSTLLAPGTILAEDQEVQYDADIIYFTPLLITLDSIEYLKLQGGDHLRLLFEKNEEVWSVKKLVP